MHKNGFTVFFAVLVSSLALAVGLAIYDLLQRELALSQVATQSQYAIYAADTGAECALYWDQKYLDGSGNKLNGGAGSVFSTSTLDDQEPTSANSIPCNTASITASPPPQADASQFGDPLHLNPCSSGNTASWTAWCKTENSSAATTTFNISVASGGQTMCATVEVKKWGNPSQTTIISHGYNTCASTGVDRLERALQVNY